MKNRHWVWPAVVTTLIILLIAGGIVWALRPKAEELTGARIPVNEDVAMRHVATLTDKETSYNEGGSSWKDALWEKMPSRIRTWLFPRYQPSQPFVMNYGSIDPDELRLIMRFEYPKEWLASASTGAVGYFAITDRIQHALKEKGMQYYRLKHAPGTYSSRDSVHVTQGALVTDSSGRVVEAKPHTALLLRNVPYYSKSLEIEFLSSYDESSTVTTSYVMENPNYRKPDPLEKELPLPQTVTDAGMNVTLREFVSKVSEDDYVSFRNHGDTILAVSRRDTKEIPLSQTLPPDFFPRAEGSASDPYHSLVVFEVKENVDKDPEWGISDIDIFYDKANHQYGISGWSSRGIQGTSFITFAGDMGALGQPLKIVATLKRRKNFPSDELQTLELPLPKEGESVTSAVTATLWDKEITVNEVAYKVAGRKNDFLLPKPDSLSILSSSRYGYNAMREVFLVRDDGSTVSLDYARTSSMSNDRGSVFHYDLGRKIYWPRDAKPPVYEEFTSIGLVFISPREYPKTFEFFARPVEATGKWEGEKE